ncbi:hypothetical protein [Catalinimonas alkaloidigena]|nr:hypothetical protein [Catalinimonas alkaloidigena]
MKRLCIFPLLLGLLWSTQAQAQTSGTDAPYRRFFVGSSLFMLGNFIPDDPNPPHFVQLNVGYRLTPRDVVSLEAITWRYAWPLGIPYSKGQEAPDTKYPGYVREVGLALAYQRFWWKGVYTAVHALNAAQTYVDDNDRKVQRGYQLFMTYRLGYHIAFWRNRLFVEPSVAMTHWPINTNVPEAFARQERRWPRYFLFEPGLHFGVKF